MQTSGSASYRLQAVERPGLPAVVFLRGELDIGVCRRLREILLGFPGAGGPAPLVVDLGDATFVDSSVLGLLAEADARLSGGLRVRGASGMVARTFGLVGVDRLLDR